MLELGNNIRELIEAKKKEKSKAETHKRTTYLMISRKLKVKGKRSLAEIRRKDEMFPLIS